jgi:hypothetical protein
MAILAAGLIAAGPIVAGLLAGCDGSPTPTPTPAPTGPVRGPEAPDGGTIRVAEQGFTAGTTHAGRPIVSYGFVLENTSRKWTARNTVVTVSLTTATGRSVTDYFISPNRTVGAIIAPHQRTGAGSNSRVDLTGTARVSIRFRNTVWTPKDLKLPVGGELLAPALLTADTVMVTPGPGGPGLPATVAFTAHSGYPIVLRKVWADVIYRDGSGRIVGGTNTRLTGRSLTATYPPGSVLARLIDQNGPPGPADPARTAVYLYPDTD